MASCNKSIAQAAILGLLMCILPSPGKPSSQTTPCLSNPCENGGTCHDLPNFQFYCDCVDGYLELTCSTAVWCLSEQACGDQLIVTLAPEANVTKSTGDSTTYTCNYGIPLSGRFLYQLSVWWYRYDAADNLDILWVTYTYTSDNQPYDEPYTWGRRNSDLSASSGRFPEFYTSHQLTFNNLKTSDSQILLCEVQITWRSYSGPWSEETSQASQLIVSSPEISSGEGRSERGPKLYSGLSSKKSNTGTASSRESKNGAPMGLTVGLVALMVILGTIATAFVAVIYLKRNAQRDPLISEEVEISVQEISS